MPLLPAVFASAFLLKAGRVEAIGPLADPAASDSVRNALQPEGYRVLQDDGSLLCEIWFRKSVPTQPKAGEAGVAFGELSESMLLGVVAFPSGATDYRGQAIPAGSYTLRYALYPADGNHMGVAPYRDFLLLAPLASDRDADARFSFDDLVAMSRKAAGTHHPAPLSLLPVERPADLPSVTEEAGQVLLLVRVQTQSGAGLPLALVVKGQAEQ